MSWEESNPKSHPCPCGKSEYVVIHRSDDWGRFEERWEMRCPRCNTDYGLYTYHLNHKGMTETHYGWVKKSLLQELAELNRQMEDQKEGLRTYLRMHYGAKWLQHFRGKTKKAVWSELTRDGQVYPSLSTLYAHIRSSGLECVLEGYLNHQNVSTVTRILELNDVKLTKLIQIVRELERIVNQKERHIRQQAIG